MPGLRHTPLAILENLVSFDTESKKSNLDIIAFIESLLSSWNVACIRTPSANGQKAALFATIGPSDRGGILLSAHTDVVPVADQMWSTDPFKLRVADGRAYGRGAVDMKGFIALVLAMVPDWLAMNLNVPIHLLFSYDEEIDCLGSVETIKRFGVDLPRPIAAIVGEPTGLEVADAHKSIVTFETVVQGQEAHSSLPLAGANAISGACQLVGELDKIAQEMMERGDSLSRFDPPYTTLQVGIIKGGTAHNIIPNRCTFDWEFRGLPDLNPLEIPQRLQQFAQSTVIPRLQAHGALAYVETHNRVSVPMLAPHPGSFAETLAMSLAERNHTVAMPYCTEAGHFQQAGISTIICGAGSIAQAHQPDEYISLDDLAAGGNFLRRLGSWCTSH